MSATMDISMDLCGPYGDGMPRLRERCQVAKPRSSHFSNLDLRLGSFPGWPKACPIPVDLAAAGFYYTGVADNCICYFCGLGLKDWKPTDDPWVEHKKFSSDCPHLKMKPSSRRGSATTSTGEDVVSSNNSATSVPEPLLCKVCYQNQMCMTFLPCKHLACCETCADSLQHCAICREYIISTLKVYL